MIIVNRNFGGTLTSGCLNSEERLWELGGPEICDLLLWVECDSFLVQSTLAISTSVISNNRLSRRKI